MDVKKTLIGLTGGIGSGKTTVSKMFEKLGATIIDTDLIAREVVEPGSPALDKVVSLLGPDTLLENGRMNREYVRSRVFSDERTLMQLESILHPVIRQRVQALLEKTTGPYTILIVPLLLEKGRFYPVNRVLVTDCPESLQIERTTIRDKLEPSHVEAIMSQQLPREARVSQADDVINTDRPIDEVQASVEALHKQYTKLG